MSKSSDRRLTPEFILAPVREFFGGRIPFDACTEAENPTGAYDFCSLGSGPSGLDVAWSVRSGTWCNPPFSEIGKWVNHAIDCAGMGAEILFLSRADNRTKWFRRLADNCDMRCNIGRSVPFIEICEDGSLKKLSGDFYAYTIWHFGRQRRRFERLFSPLGEVLVGRGPVEVLTPGEFGRVAFAKHMEET